MDEEREFSRASWVNVLGNLVKLGIEGWVGLTFGSLSLVADAANSLGDVIASLVVLVGGRFTYTRPDSDHPHGHERIEPLAALFAGAIVVGMGVTILVDAGLTLLEGPTGTFHPAFLGGLLVAIAVKLGQWWYTHRVNEDVDSPGLRALVADAASDLYATTAALVGVLGIAFGYPILDPIAAGVVSLLIVREGGAIAVENVRYLTGVAPSKAIRRRIRAVARSHPDVSDVRDVRAHYVGPEIEVELRAKVADGSTVDETQAIESELVEEIGNVDDVHHVHVHFEPEAGPNAEGGSADSVEDEPADSEEE